MQKLKETPNKTWKLPSDFKDWEWWSHAINYKTRKPIEYTRENFVFRAGLKADGYGRGRSSVNFGFVDSTDPELTYVMAPKAMATFISAILSGEVEIKAGAAWGTFTFIKQGTQYSIIPCKLEA